MSFRDQSEQFYFRFRQCQLQLLLFQLSLVTILSKKNLKLINQFPTLYFFKLLYLCCYSITASKDVSNFKYCSIQNFVKLTEEYNDCSVSNHLVKNTSNFFTFLEISVPIKQTHVHSSFKQYQEFYKKVGKRPLEVSRKLCC